MGIEITYVCDRCKQVVRPLGCAQVMIVTSPPDKPTPLPYGIIQRSQMWCGPCLEKSGIVGQPYHKPEPAQHQPVSLEDLLRQMVTEIVEENS